MAKARNWEGLKPATRKRYERAGVSRSDYMSGMNLQKARGHGSTPEHPEDSVKKGSEQYWTNKLVKKNFQLRHKYRGPHDLDDLEPDMEFPESETIELARSLDEEELADLLAADRITWGWMFYH